jgi:hypothetical protein
LCDTDVGPSVHQEYAAQGLEDEKDEGRQVRQWKRYDDLGVGPAHAVEVGPNEVHERVKPDSHDREMEDLWTCVEGVLEGVPEDLWV